MKTKNTGLRLAILGLLFSLLVIGIWGINLVVHSIRLYNNLDDLQAITSNDIDEIDLNNAGDLLHDTASDLTNIRVSIWPLFPIFQIFEGLPEIGPLIGQIEPVLNYSTGLVKTGDEIFIVLSPLMINQTQSNEPLTSRLFNTLNDSRSNLAEASKAMVLAQKGHDNLEMTKLPTNLQEIFLKFDENFSTIKGMVILLEVLPDLMGIKDSPKQYLLQAQNRDELRGTGGFISALGLLELEQGQIIHFSLGNSYDVDDFSKAYPAPPTPIQEFMLSGYWLPRDANWSPDFPTAARDLQALYSLSTSIETAGVIAFDQGAIKTILNLVGPIEIPEFPEPITTENVEFLMQQAWAPSPDEGLSQEWLAHRKDFMPVLGRAILDKLITNDLKLLNQLSKEIINEINEGHILIYFSDPNAQRALETASWSNEINPVSADFLALIDSNIGFNKTDALLDRSLTYNVNLTNPLAPTGEVIVQYKNLVLETVPCVHEASYGEGTYQDLINRCYWDYWRVYLPGDSQLISSSAQHIPGEMLLSGNEWVGTIDTIQSNFGTVEFGGLVLVPTDSFQEIILQIAMLPSIITVDDSGNVIYTLRVNKQAGLDKLKLNLSILGPIGYSLQPEPNWYGNEIGSWTWDGVIVKDTVFTLIFLRNLSSTN